MLNFFKKKSKLEFVSLIPELTQLMPIESTKDVKFKWVKSALADYKKQKADNPNMTERFTHIARCPGINQIQRTGWIQRAWQDIAIKTDGSGDGFGWLSAVDQQRTDVDHNWKWPYMGHHPKELYSQFNHDGRSLKSILKVQSPWMVYIPKGYYLLSMPIPYPDNHDFTATIGFLDGDYGPNFLNVEMFWNNLDGVTIIPAGTPLCQYILVKKDEVDVEVREYQQRDIDNIRLRASTIDNQWISNSSKLKTYIWK